MRVGPDWLWLDGLESSNILSNAPDRFYTYLEVED